MIAIVGGHSAFFVRRLSKDFASWLNDGGPALLKPAANDVLQRWPVSRRVNSSRAPTDDPTLIERVEVK